MTRADFLLSIKKKEFKHELVACFFLALFVGFVIGILHVGTIYGLKLINKVISDSLTDKTIIIPLYIGIATIFVILNVFNRFLKTSIDLGNSYFEYDHLDRKVKWYDFILVFFMLALAFFSGLPISWIDSFDKISKLPVDKISSATETNDSDLSSMSSSMVVGIAFASPLAGLAHALEEKKNIDLAFVIKAILAIGVSSGVAFLVRYMFKLEMWSFVKISEFEQFHWDSLIDYLILGMILAVAGLAIKVVPSLISKFVTKKKINKSILNNVLYSFFFGSFFVMTFFGFYLDYTVKEFAMFDGMRLFAMDGLFSKDWVLIVMTFVIALYLLLFPNLKESHGMILPIIVFGFLIGNIVAKHGIMEKTMSVGETNMMAVISAISLYGIIYKKPFTAFTLMLTFSIWKIIPYELIPFLLAVIPGYALLLLTKVYKSNKQLELYSKKER